MLAAMLAAIMLTVPALAVSSEDEDTWIEPEYQGYCTEVGRKYNICPEILEAIIEHESWGIPTVSNGDCVGLMQVNQTYHAERAHELGVTNLYDPYGNILVAGDYLRELLEQYNDMALALGHYGGYSDADELDGQGRMTEYAEWVLARSERLERIHGK